MPEGRRVRTGGVTGDAASYTMAMWLPQRYYRRRGVSTHEEHGEAELTALEMSAAYRCETP